VDTVHLVDIDVVNLVMPREIEACEVTLITLRRFDVTAAEDAKITKSTDCLTQEIAGTASAKAIPRKQI
jgi:hypothetical protein